MATYSVCETTNLRAVHYAERIFDAVADFDVENGMIGYLDGLAENETHTYKFVKGTKAGKHVVLVHNPEWTEDATRKIHQRKDNFFIPAGTKFRAFVLHLDDEFALSAEGFTVATRENANADKYVTVDAETGKLVVADAPVEDAVFNGKIMRTRMMGSTLITGVRKYCYSRKMYDVKVETLA